MAIFTILCFRLEKKMLKTFDLVTLDYLGVTFMPYTTCAQSMKAVGLQLFEVWQPRKSNLSLYHILPVDQVQQL